MDTSVSQSSGSASPETGSQKIAGKEFKKLGYSLFIWMPESRLECRCSYVPREQGSMMTLDELKAYLVQAGVTEGVFGEACEDFAVRAAAGQNLINVLLASGVAPVAGQDGWLSYIAQPSLVDTHKSDELEKIDLHNVQTFINVMPGDEIARIVPPTPGEPGRNVSGQVIPPPPGKPLSLKLGENVTTADDGCLLISASAGRVCVTGGEISVVQEYIVSGDVNFRVGSIVFNGFVEVRGDVLDGFNVTAVKGLRVNGNIGACAISSDGDISFCGMDGQEKGTITCGGSITANFIHDCIVECAGNVVIDVELHNCQVKALGSIVVNKGAIAGGSYTALKGIESRKAGSPASVRTMLRAGIDYREMAEFERLLAEMEENSARTKEASSLQEIEVLRKDRAKLAEALMAIRTRSDACANPKINIKAMLYDNTFVRIGMAAKQKLDEREGPFSIIENTIEGGLRFLALTSLDVPAADIERAFVREQAIKR